jgi:hypothetical protein
VEAAVWWELITQFKKQKSGKRAPTVCDLGDPEYLHHQLLIAHIIPFRWSSHTNCTSSRWKCACRFLEAWSMWCNYMKDYYVNRAWTSAVLKIEALIWVSFWRALKFQPFNWRVGSNPRRQSKNIEWKYNTHMNYMNYMEHVSSTMWESRINHLTLLLVLTMPYVCWFLCHADYFEDFKWRLQLWFGVAFWRVVLREVYFEGPNRICKALKTSILNIRRVHKKSGFGPTLWQVFHIYNKGSMLNPLWSVFPRLWSPPMSLNLTWYKVCVSLESWRYMWSRS